MRYFVQIRLPNGVRWRTVSGASASLVAQQMFQETNPDVFDLFVANASHTGDVFCDYNVDCEETRYYLRTEMASLDRLSSHT